MRPDCTPSSTSLETLTIALAKSHLNTSIYTSRDPVRLSSLNDVSESLSLGDERDRPRSASSVSLDSNRSGTPVGRRKPPAPPNKKFSIASSTTSYSSDDRSTTPGLGTDDDLMEEGGKGVPTPIIEVNDVPVAPGWVTFST